MTDEEYDKQVAVIHRRFAFRVFRAVAWLMAALFVLSWTAPDLRGPLLTLVMVGVPVASWTVDASHRRQNCHPNHANADDDD